MKKIVIITAIVLTTGLTAFSLTKRSNKIEAKLEVTSSKTVDTNVTLATAD